MIKLENTVTYGWEAAIRGMRNPMNSWYWSDSVFYDSDGDHHDILGNSQSTTGSWPSLTDGVWINYDEAYIKENDKTLMMKLAKAGPVHAKYRRMITVSVDITAPLYWWKEFDTYKVGTVANSCSTMHKIHANEFMLYDFSHEHLDTRCIELLKRTIDALNDYRKWYLNYNPDELGVSGCPSKKDIWWQMIQLLPSSYNQRRTVMLNYEVLADIYPMRKDHKLDEWHDFCHWIEDLPYSEIITLQEDDD